MSFNRIFSVLLGLIFAPIIHAADPVYTGWFSELALDGYDPVAYFNEGAPAEGSSEHRYEWNGAIWQFTSAANRDAFAADPVAYAPQYGGYCAWAVAENKEAAGNPQHWRIVDGKLYVNYNADVQTRWEKDIPGFIEKADQHWPELLEQ